MEVKRATHFQFALFEILRHVGIGFKLFDKICVVAPGVLGFPRFHRVALAGVFAQDAAKSFLRRTVRRA